MILSSSSRIRSAETMDRRSWPASDRLDQFGGRLQLESGDEPGGPEHPQRVVGEGDLGVERRAQPVHGQVGQAVEGIDQLEIGKPQGHGVDGEVPTGEIVFDPVAEGHLRLAGVGPVGLGPVGGDLVLLAALSDSRWCRTACPGSRPRRPTRTPTASMASGRASVVKSRSRVPSAPAAARFGRRWRRGPSRPPGRGSDRPTGSGRTGRRWPRPTAAVARGTRRRG